MLGAAPGTGDSPVDGRDDPCPREDGTLRCPCRLQPNSPGPRAASHGPSPPAHTCSCSPLPLTSTGALAMPKVRGCPRLGSGHMLVLTPRKPPLLTSSLCRKVTKPCVPLCAPTTRLGPPSSRPRHGSMLEAGHLRRHPQTLRRHKTAIKCREVQGGQSGRPCAL